MAKRTKKIAEPKAAEEQQPAESVEQQITEVVEKAAIPESGSEPEPQDHVPVNSAPVLEDAEAEAAALAAETKDEALEDVATDLAADVDDESEPEDESTEDIDSDEEEVDVEDAAEDEDEVEVDEEEEAGASPRPAGKQERLQKILAQSGVASRRRAEELIEQGRVQVNGKVVTELGSKADASRDHIRVDGKLLHGAERLRYFVLNKPKGYVTTVKDPEGRSTVMEFFAKLPERLYPVGRLDYQSEGLLLVTNDGELANKLTRAASGVEKTYLVKVSGQPTEDELDILRRGVSIDRGRPGEGRVRTSPARIRQVRQGDNPWYEVVLIEGRNRELRKMFEEVGHFVEKIRRVGYGPLVLDQEPGNFRELEPEELNALRLASEGKLRTPKSKDLRRRNALDAGRLPTVLPKPTRPRPEQGFGSSETREGRAQGKFAPKRSFDRGSQQGSERGFGREGDREQGRQEDSGFRPKPGRGPEKERTGSYEQGPDRARRPAAGRFRAEARPDSRPDARSGGRPGFGSDPRSGSRPSSRPGARSGSRLNARPDSRYGSRPDSRPGDDQESRRSGGRPSRPIYGQAGGGRSAGGREPGKYGQGRPAKPAWRDSQAPRESRPLADESGRQDLRGGQGGPGRQGGRGTWAGGGRGGQGRTGAARSFGAKPAWNQTGSKGGSKERAPFHRPAGPRREVQDFDEPATPKKPTKLHIEPVEFESRGPSVGRDKGRFEDRDRSPRSRPGFDRPRGERPRPERGEIGGERSARGSGPNPRSSGPTRGEAGSSGKPAGRSYGQSAGKSNRSGSGKQGWKPRPNAGGKGKPSGGGRKSVPRPGGKRY